ncbi:hypothetical protein N7481_004719 [Penicillium waksmanii]|uniref:uncharacterized protein n=1 Tax=Penicillium waksmanii TaxID=69791 RepID=UPI0025498C77|nr:uncharacterized protein N7481_004719 [Penicillium waksmanii]KAJ5989509.1 hypothetical protein N7481_004719 [Penicillium waksmanii]
MCEAGNTVITGYSTTTDYARSLCSDVVVAVDWVISNCALCPGDDCLVGGVAATYDNGDLPIMVQGTNV